MNLDKAHLLSHTLFGKHRIASFYILAFAPILLIFFIEPFNAVISFYGFLIFFLKSQKLTEIKEASFAQKILGLVVIVCSFLASFLVTAVFPSAAFYGGANYALYLLGIFAVFFSFSAIREALAPLFLVAATTSSSLVSESLKPFLSPFSNDFAHIILSVLNALGVRAHIYYAGTTPVIAFPSLSGRLIAAAFVYECIGVYSALVFSIILVVILLEDSSSVKMKTAFAIAGIMGTFALNIVRVTIILLTDYFYGLEVGGNVHYIIGYILFSIWLAVFFLTYSKRQTVKAKLTGLWHKINPTPAPK